MAAAGSGVAGTGVAETAAFIAGAAVLLYLGFVAPARPETGMLPGWPRRQAERVAQRGRRIVRLTSADRVLFPEDGITKGDLFDYYRAIAPVLLPHLKDRPFTMKRFRNGAAGGFFFQKDAPERHAEVDPNPAVPDLASRGRVAASSTSHSSTTSSQRSGWCRCTAST